MDKAKKTERILKMTGFKCPHCDRALLIPVNWRDVDYYIQLWSNDQITSARLGEILEMWANGRELPVIKAEDGD